MCTGTPVGAADNQLDLCRFMQVCVGVDGILKLKFRPNPMFDGNMGLGRNFKNSSLGYRASAAQLRINIHTR